MSYQNTGSNKDKAAASLLPSPHESGEELLYPQANVYSGTAKKTQAWVVNVNMNVYILEPRSLQSRTLHYAQNTR